MVGTYRVMLPDDALCAGGLYIEGEFFTTRLRPIRHDLVELGRLSARYSRRFIRA